MSQIGFWFTQDVCHIQKVRQFLTKLQGGHDRKYIPGMN